MTSGAAAGHTPCLQRNSIYDPALTTGKTTTGRHAHTATLLGDGTVLVAGEGKNWLWKGVYQLPPYRYGGNLQRGHG